MNESDRKAFEEWFSNSGLDDGLPHTEIAPWEAWQAALEWERNREDEVEWAYLPPHGRYEVQENANKAYRDMMDKMPIAPPQTGWKCNCGGTITMEGDLMSCENCGVGARVTVRYEE